MRASFGWKKSQAGKNNDDDRKYKFSSFDFASKTSYEMKCLNLHLNDTLDFIVVAHSDSSDSNSYNNKIEAFEKRAKNNTTVQLHPLSRNATSALYRYRIVNDISKVYNQMNKFEWILTLTLNSKRNQMNQQK